MKYVEQIEKYFEDKEALISMSKLADKLGCSKTTVSLKLKKMIKEGSLSKVRGNITYYRRRED